MEKVRSMMKDREELLESALEHYGQWYDVSRCDPEQAPLTATAFYHEHGVGYALSRKAEMWSADRHEYVYLFSVPHLTEAICRDCIETAKRLGSEHVKPEEGHMCSAIVAAVLCDTADAEAVAVLKRTRMHKSFRFMLQGWMELHTACAVVKEDLAAGNAAGRSTVRFLGQLLHPKKKRFPWKLPKLF